MILLKNAVGVAEECEKDRGEETRGQRRWEPVAGGQEGRRGEEGVWAGGQGAENTLFSTAGKRKETRSRSRGM